MSKHEERTGENCAEKLDEGTGNVLGYEMKGKLTEKEFKTLSEDFKAVIAEHGKVRLLVRVPEMPGAEFGALAEDLKLAPYASDIERYPLVGDVSLLEWVGKLGNAVIEGEIQHFEDSRYEEAWRWVQS
jgi:hypothetical protein